MSVRKEVNKYVSMQITIFSMPFSIGLTGSSSGHEPDAEDFAGNPGVWYPVEPLWMLYHTYSFL